MAGNDSSKFVILVGRGDAIPKPTLRTTERRLTRVHVERVPSTKVPEVSTTQDKVPKALEFLIFSFDLATRDEQELIEVYHKHKFHRSPRR